MTEVIAMSIMAAAVIQMAVLAVRYNKKRNSETCELRESNKKLLSKCAQLNAALSEIEWLRLRTKDEWVCCEKYLHNAYESIIEQEELSEMHKNIIGGYAARIEDLKVQLAAAARHAEDMDANIRAMRVLLKEKQNRIEEMSKAEAA